MEPIRYEHLYNLNYFDPLTSNQQNKNMINTAIIKDKPVEIYLSSPKKKNSSISITKNPIKISKRISLPLTTVNNFNTIEHNLNKNLALHSSRKPNEENQFSHRLQFDYSNTNSNPNSPLNKLKSPKNNLSINLLNPCSKKLFTLKQSFAKYKKLHEAERPKLVENIFNDKNNFHTIDPKNEPFDLTEIKKKYKAGEGNDHLKKKKENLMNKVLNKKPESKIDNKNKFFGNNLNSLHTINSHNSHNSFHNTLYSDIYNPTHTKNHIIDEIRTMEKDIEEKLLDEELKKMIMKKVSNNNNRGSSIVPGKIRQSIMNLYNSNSDQNENFNKNFNRKASMITPLLNPLKSNKNSTKNENQNENDLFISPKRFNRFNSMILTEGIDMKLNAHQQSNRNSSIVIDEEQLIKRRDRYKNIQQPNTHRESVLSLISYKDSNSNLNQLTNGNTNDVTNRKRIFSENFDEREKDYINNPPHKMSIESMNSSSNYASNCNSFINKFNIPKIDLESLHGSMHNIHHMNNNSKKNLNSTMNIDRNTKEQFSKRSDNTANAGNSQKNSLKNLKNSKKNSKNFKSSHESTYMQKINEKFSSKYKEIIAKSEEQKTQHRFSELFSEDQINFIVKTQAQVELDNLKSDYLMKLKQYHLFENNKKIKSNLASYENKNNTENSNNNMSFQHQHKESGFGDIGKIKNTLTTNHNHSHSNHVYQLSQIPNFNKTHNSSMMTNDDMKNFTQTRLSTFRLKEKQDKKEKKDKIKRKLFRALKNSDVTRFNENGNIDV
jgi:hypothetical protein